MLGINFLLHGLVRLLGDFTGFIDYVLKGFEKTALPPELITPVAYLIPPWEVLVGICLLTQYKPRWTLIGAAGLMSVLISGMCLQQKWDVVGTQMIYAACIYLLGSELRPPFSSEE